MVFVIVALKWGRLFVHVVFIFQVTTSGIFVVNRLQVKQGWVQPDAAENLAVSVQAFPSVYTIVLSRG